MPLVPPSIPPNASPFSPSPALDALRDLGTASPSSGAVPNPYRMTETSTKEGVPIPAQASNRARKNAILLGLINSGGSISMGDMDLIYGL